MNADAPENVTTPHREIGIRNRTMSLTIRDLEETVQIDVIIGCRVGNHRMFAGTSVTTSWTRRKGRAIAELMSCIAEEDSDGGAIVSDETSGGVPDQSCVIAVSPDNTQNMVIFMRDSQTVQVHMTAAELIAVAAAINAASSDEEVLGAT